MPVYTVLDARSSRVASVHLTLSATLDAADAEIDYAAVWEQTGDHEWVRLGAVVQRLPLESPAE